MTGQDENFILAIQVSQQQTLCEFSVESTHEDIKQKTNKQTKKLIYLILYFVHHFSRLGLGQLPDFPSKSTLKLLKLTKAAQILLWQQPVNHQCGEET